MSDNQKGSEQFVEKLTQIIESNISNEKFGVSELADEIGMSRSNLLRKIQKQTNLSVSQFIRQIRLQHAMMKLEQNEQTVSEVSYEVGFSSTSYFVKCFHDHYGYPPGEVGKQKHTKENVLSPSKPQKNKRTIVFISFGFLLVLFALFFYISNPFKANEPKLDKSIAVLPFKNDSQDSSNIYIVNGLMESILNNLQKIEDLRVISRTSVEKYRNSNMSIPEIAEELNVSYFVEGSGQKIGNQILLNIQLIKAENDNHLWAEQYNREVKDIFTIQNEVATNIATKIEAIITPEEAERINKIPTKNIEAHKNLLKGLELTSMGNKDSALQSIPYFKKAIKLDPEYARAYAAIGITFFYLDIMGANKQYTDSIAYYADKALLHDPQLTQSLLAKAFSYMIIGKYNQAEPYLHKAVEYNPNSALAINTLADFYTTYVPNTSKYLEYALKGIQIDIAAHDSVTRSFIYLHVSNALIQSGFSNEAKKFINLSLEFNPNNLYSAYVKAFIMYAINGNINETEQMLLEAFSRDTTRLDILQEIGKIYYYKRDYKTAYSYYKAFTDVRKQYDLKLFTYENAHIAHVFLENGFKHEADSLMVDYMKFVENDASIYKNLHLSSYYTYYDDLEKGMDYLKQFTSNTDYHYWIVLFLKDDPIYHKLKDQPEFKETFKKIEDNFWLYHKEIKADLKTKGLL